MNQIISAKHAAEALRFSLMVTGAVSIIHPVNSRAVFLSNFISFVPYFVALPVNKYIKEDSSIKYSEVGDWQNIVLMITILSSLHIQQMVGKAVDKDFDSFKIIGTSIAITFIYAGILQYAGIPSPFVEE